MERFLDGSYPTASGGARAWAVGAGVPGEALDRMVDLLLEPAGCGRDSSRRPAGDGMPLAAAAPGLRLEACDGFGLGASVLAGTRRVLRSATGGRAVLVGGLPAVAVRPAQVAGLPLPRGGHRGRRPVGGHRRRPVEPVRRTPATPEDVAGWTPAPGPQGALAIGRPGRRRRAGRRPTSAPRPPSFRRCAAGCRPRPPISTQVLRVDPAGHGADRASRDQVVEVMRAADDVQQAAVASASDANGQRVRDLVRDAGTRSSARRRPGLGPGRPAARHG